MNVFDAVKAELNARQVVESYGIAVRHNGMCCCPFHGDKNPSMKVDEKRFHCFGCGEDGDVIQFAARYFDLSRYDAAKKLAEDFGVAYEKWKPERDEKGKWYSQSQDQNHRSKSIGRRNTISTERFQIITIVSRTGKNSISLRQWMKHGMSVL